MEFQSARERIVVRDVENSVVEHLQKVLNVSNGIATILAGRKLKTFEECRRFFRPDTSQFHDPFLFTDMEGAVNRIQKAITNRERIVVYGDYDVDGITSTSLMMHVLQNCGATCTYYLPNRLTEGYGVSIEGIGKIAEMGATLIVTVDCGSTSVKEVQYALSLGIDMVVTDHHEMHGQTPSGCMLLNPKAPGCHYPDRNLAGVGVALKLCQGLAIGTGRGEALWKPHLELAALGTAADIVPLIGENRIIAKLGFSMLSHSEKPGISALVAEQKLNDKPISTAQVVFQLAPCINAVGRLGDPSKAVELLLTDDPVIAVKYARELRNANFERRSIDSGITDEAYAWVEGNCHPERDFAIVAGMPHWHVGVIGIVAAKLVEKYHRPTILFSLGTDGFARGSGRSIPKLHLLEALNGCSSMLAAFGGHAAAAGMRIHNDRIDLFRKHFNDEVRNRLTPDDLTPVVTADVKLSLQDITPSFYRIVKQLEPFGMGNMRPVLYCTNLKNRYSPRKVGSNHLKMKCFESGSMVMDAIAFNFGDRLQEVSRAESLGLAFSLDENEWNGKVNLQMKVKGITI